MGSPIGLWTSVSGSMAQSENVDTIANNLANSNTAGFKRDLPTFKEYLTSVENPPSPAVDIPRTIFKDSDFYHFDGRENAMVNLDKVHTDHTQGNLRLTNAPFDVGVEGKGFFAVQAPGGILFTRAGNFKVGGDGKLVTNEGYPVLGLTNAAKEAAQSAVDALAAANTQPEQTPQQPNSAAPNIDIKNPFTYIPKAGEEPLLAPINLSDALGTRSNANLIINTKGEVIANDQVVSTIALANFPESGALKKLNAGLYSNPNPENVPTVDAGSRIHQGMLESSNVSPVTEIMSLLKANRLFETNMKAIKAYNDLAGKEANEVGKL